MATKFCLCDLQTVEVFDTESEALARANDWLDDCKQCAIDARKSADDDTIARWDKEEAFYRSSDDITMQIRLYRVDTAIYGEIDDFPDESREGVERLRTWFTTYEDLLSEIG